MARKKLVATMKCQTMMILGGYGAAGLCISELLLRETELDLIIAGRNEKQALQAAQKLNSEFQGNRVRGMMVDASNSEKLKESFKSCDTVLVVVPITSSKIGGDVVQAAFGAGISSIDLSLDDQKQALLRRLEGKIRNSGRFFLTEAGFIPGLPSMMAFLAAQQLDSIETLQFGAMMKDGSASYGSVVDLLMYAADPAHVYKNGAWLIVPKTSSVKIDFGPEFGTNTCYPTELYELRRLPEGICQKRIGFYSAGVNPITDLVMAFWMMLGLYKTKWTLNLGTKLIIWTAKRFTKRPYITMVRLEALGKKGDDSEKCTITISHEDPYVATAIATVAAILQLLDGTIKEPGVHIQGHVVNPKRYLADIERLGMDVQIEKSRSTSL